MERYTTDGVNHASLVLVCDYEKPWWCVGQSQQRTTVEGEAIDTFAAYERLKRTPDELALDLRQLSEYKRQIEAGELVRKPKIAPIMQDVIEMFGLEGNK